MTDVFELEAQKRQLLHDRAKELSDIRTSYSERLAQLRDERKANLALVYRRYQKLLEEKGWETLTMDLSVIQAERCPLLVSAIFGDAPGFGPKVIQLNELRKACISCMSSLHLREQGVLIHRLGLDGSPAETLKAVGIRYQVSIERIRQIEAKALRKMRHPRLSRQLKDYLD